MDGGPKRSENRLGSGFLTSGNPLTGKTLLPAAVQAELQRILISEPFRQAERMQRFLKFTVTADPSELKEAVIGVQVFDRDPGYDPKTDSIVRVEARRLRTKLAEYYTGEGAGSAVRIELPKGSYVPLIREIPADPPRPRGARKLAFVSAAALLVCAAVLLAVRPSRHPPMVSRQITYLPGYSSDPAFSPDGQTIAFAWAHESKTDGIYLIEPGQDAPRKLTSSERAEISPAWSPTGRELAFLRTGEGGGYQLVRLDLAAHKERVIADGFEKSRIDWSRDGKWIAVSRRPTPGARTAVFVVAPDSGEIRQASWPTSTIEGDLDPAISPDSTQVAFRRRQEAAIADVWLQPLKSGAEQARRLTFTGSPVEGIAWLPDGSGVLAGIQIHNVRQLWTVPISGRTPSAVVMSSLRPSYPAISRSGDRVAFVTRYFDSNIWRIAADAPADAPAAEFAPSTAPDSCPRYSPSGKLVAFRTGRTGSDEIWVAADDGTQPRQLTHISGPVTGSPAWSPDGRRVVFDSRLSGNARIYMVAADGGEPRMITSGPGNDYVPWFSRDGKWIYFSSDRTGSAEVWRQPSEGGEARRVTQHGGRSAIESPDGRWLYYVKPAEPGLWRTELPLREGAAVEERVADVPTLPMWRNWTLDATGVYFIEPQGTAGLLRHLEFRSGAVRTVRALTAWPLNGDAGLTLSPDGRTILYAQADRIGSDLGLLENFR
jgi:Tol biopolymer transport system component